MSRCSALLKLFCRFSYCFCGKCSLERRITSLVKPMMAFMGVRSSCDMFAKNSDLCREACCKLLIELPQLSECARRSWFRAAPHVRAPVGKALHS